MVSPSPVVSEDDLGRLDIKYFRSKTKANKTINRTKIYLSLFLSVECETGPTELTLYLVAYNIACTISKTHTHIVHAARYVAWIYKPEKGDAAFSGAR